MLKPTLKLFIFVAGQPGRSKNLAARFLQAAEGSNKEIVIERRKISFDRDAGCVLESHPEERPDVVKSGGPTGWEIDMESGHTRNKMDPMGSPNSNTYQCAVPQ